VTSKVVLPSLFLVSLVSRLIYLDSLPAELFGDVIDHIDVAQKILTAGPKISWWFGGDGPLFPHLHAVTVFFMGPSFYAAKLTSALIGTLAILALYIFSYFFSSSKRVALFSSLLASFSFWQITFSHQAKPYILTALFVPLALALILKKHKLQAGIILGLGMLSQASFWGFALLALTSPVSTIGFFLFSFPLAHKLFSTSNSLLSPHSYLGEKLYTSSLLESVVTFIKNILTNIKALALAGDSTFRHTIPGQSHLDQFTFLLALFGLVGIIFLLKEHKLSLSKLFFVLMFPAFLCLVPASLDINNPANTPNMGRTLAFSTFSFLFAGYGLSYISHRTSLQIGVSIFLVIAALNLYKYFYVYPRYLPDKNIPFGLTISDFIKSNSLPLDKVFLLGCCWGQWGQPEPKAIRINLENPAILPEISLSSLSNDNLCTTLMFRKDNIYHFFSAPNVSESILSNQTCLSPVDTSPIYNKKTIVAKHLRFRGVN
jgi:hypothetical protein